MQLFWSGNDQVHMLVHVKRRFVSSLCTGSVCLGHRMRAYQCRVLLQRVA